MDIQYFFNVLKRRKWLIILPMILTSIATYYFVDQRPQEYDAKALVATGIVDITGYNSKENNPFLQKMAVDISYANLIEFITTKKTVRFLSYHLLIHDILADTTSNDPPFRQPEQGTLNYSKAELLRLAHQLQGRIHLDTLESVLDVETDRMYREVAKAYKYDYETLMKDKFYVERSGETDLLQMKFVDSNPKLCAFAINNFCKTLTAYHENEQMKVDVETHQGFSEFAAKKKNVLDNLENQLNIYRVEKGLVDLGAQAEATVKQIQELETAREEAQRNVNSYRQVIKQKDYYLDDNEKYNVTNKSKSILNNKAILNISERLAALTNQHIDETNEVKKRNLKSQIELTKKNLDMQISRLAVVKAKEDPGTVDKGNEILIQRITAETELILALESVKSIDDELEVLRARRDNFVTDDTYTSSLGNKIEIANREYKQALEKANLTKFNTISARHRLQPLDWADVPEEPIPDNKFLLSGFAGIVMGSLSTVLLFMLAFFDLSLNSPNQFEKFTNLNLLGTLNKLKDSNIDLKDLFSRDSGDKLLENFKESLRKIRYVVEESNATTFLFTSTKDGEGKTFLILSLAYALTLKNKKILLIDTNFKNNTLTKMSNNSMNDNLLHTRLIGENNLGEQFEAKRINAMFNLDSVDIIGNRGTSNSPSEFFAGRDFQNFINELSESYDYVFLEGASLNKYSDTRELVGFAEKIVSVFSAESEIKDIDKDSINYLLSLENKFIGSILNKIDLKNQS